VITIKIPATRIIFYRSTRRVQQESFFIVVLEECNKNHFL
jgi:hypothetical protein